MESLSSVTGLFSALGLGLLIGLERGWRDRRVSEGGRIAGLRTFALIGLLGGLVGLMMDDFGPWPLLGVLLCLTILQVVAYQVAQQASGNLSITTAVASLLTLVLGAMAARGQVSLAFGAAVVVATLLNLKPTLHRWVGLIEHRELSAGLQLLVLSLVILPVLPDRGMGPYLALNPYLLWTGVVVIASLSLLGHLAMRITGPQRGLLWTGLLGGLASSTASTLALGRIARELPALAAPALAGSLASCGMMFLRMTVLVATIQPGLLATYGPALVVAGTTLLFCAVWLWHRLSRATTPTEMPVETVQPFDLGTALGFGLFLGAVAVLIPAAREGLGERGLYVVATLSGLGDVDAIVISVARLHGTGAIPIAATLVALNLAVLANMVAKVCMAWSTAGRAFGLRLAAGYGVAALLGGLVLLFTVP